MTPYRGMSRQRQHLICSSIRLLLSILLCGCMMGCTFPFFVTTPQMTGSWRGRACDVQVLDERNKIHNVIGIEILEAYEYDVTTPGLESGDKEPSDEVFWTFSTNRTPLLVTSDGYLVVEDDYRRLGQELVVSGLIKHSGEPRLPGSALRAIRLSSAAMISDGEKKTPRFTAGPELVICVD
jgi:hypothetical protein